MTGNVLGHLLGLFHLTSIYHTHFTDKETLAEGSLVTLPKVTEPVKRELGFDPWFV